MKKKTGKETITEEREGAGKSKMENKEQQQQAYQAREHQKLNA